jgi:multiple sugar transport system permease protein
MSYFTGQYTQLPQLIQATALMALALPVVLFIIAQRAFVQGVVVTGVDK